MIDIWGVVAIVAKFLLYLGVLTSAGTVFATLLFELKKTRRFAITFALLGLAAAVMSFVLGGALLTGDIGGVTDPDMLGLLWTTPVGTALVYRLTGLSILIAGATLAGVGLWLAAIGGGIALWSFATVGHVPDHGANWVNAVLLFHLAAAALWIGILTPLRRLASRGLTSEAADLGHDFGRWAGGFVPLLVLAGFVMAYILMGSPDMLFGTGYGRALLLKVIFVAGLLGLAALNKLRLVPGLRAGDKDAAHYLSRSIAMEWAVILAVLLTTAVLTSVLTLPA